MKRALRVISAVAAAIMLFSVVSCTADKPSDTSDTDSTEQTTQNGQVTDTPETRQFAFVENEGKTNVSTGYISYTAEGYESTEGEKFIINNGFTAKTDGVEQRFNRLTFKYSADAPMVLDVTYELNSNPKTNSFFLEAAEDGTFRCLISSYINGGVASRLDTVAVKTCTGENAQFMLYDITSECIDTLNRDVYYIENDRYKLGVNLGWGGGISYIEDKTASVEGLKNLVNNHDTGRLIQQSYYGTAGNEFYQPEVSMGAMWVYNPVQGGDQYNNASRLIDFSVTENTVYVKAQPQDWSHNNDLTPSYMENTYTIYEDRIQVDNRFVDFSGWEHRYASQELPALYTVSYLTRFTWYDGVNSWQDDTLSYKDDLHFWGDASYVKECTMALKSGNTETWCAWSTDDNSFGIGLYVPNIDVLKAGRSEYDGSKEASANSTNYVAPLDIIKMVSYVPIEYSYIITTGSVEQIRQTFKSNRDFTDNASLHINYMSSRVYGGDVAMVDASFDKEADLGLISDPYDTEISYSEEEHAARIVTSTGVDPHISFDYSHGDVYNAEDRPTLTIEYMIPTDNSLSNYSCDLFLCAGDTTLPDGNKRVRKNLIADGQYHTLTVDLASLGFWSGEIHLIRFDYFDYCGEKDVVYLRSFKLS